MGQWHPECPARLQAIEDQLIASRIDSLIEREAAPLADGSHEFKVTATDVAGRSGTATAKFKVDTSVPPTVKFVKRPPRVVRTNVGSVKLSFALTSNQPGSTFKCKIDKGAFRPCKESFSKRFKIGKHAVAAEAVSSAGTVGKPVTVKFRVKKVTIKHKKRRHHGHQHR